MWQSFLMYANQSWIELENSRKVWVPIQPTDDFVPQPRINRFSPTVDAVASNFSAVPEVEATPIPPDDPTANMVARIATELAEYAIKSQGLRKQRGQMKDKAGLAAQLFVLCGGLFSKIDKRKRVIGSSPRQTPQPAHGVTCPTCDTYTRVPKQPDQPAPETCQQCGSPVQVENTEQMGQQTGPDGQPVMDENSEWEIVCDIQSTLYAFPRPGSTCLDDSPVFLWAQRKTLEEIYYQFDGFEATADSVWPDGYSVTYEHALNFWYTGYSSQQQQVKDTCMLLEMFVAPGKVKDFPNGFYLASANDKFVGGGEWDYPEHPLTMACYLDLPTIFFPRSISFDLCEIQRELNRYESIICLHAMTGAVDPIVLDLNTKVSEITGRCDKVITWRSIGPNSQAPKRLGAGHLDDGVYKQRDNLHAEFQNISMAVNAFRGEQEGAITAASAIQQLRAQAEIMFGKPSMNWTNFWCETVRKMVVFMKKYYTFPQLVAILGPGKEAEVTAFLQSDLALCLSWEASTHGLPRTRDEKRQEMMVLWDKGALDINDPAVRQKLFDLFGETGMMQSFNKDATRARLENQVIKAGGMVHCQPVIEDMQVHLYFHKDQAKSLDFDKWTPQAKTNLIEHIAETQTILNEQAMQMMQMQQGQPQGGGPPKIPGGGTAKPPRGGKPAPGGNSPTQAQVQGNEGAVASQGVV